LAAALRESQEEIALAPGQVQALGYLDPFVTITGYRVTPVVAVVDPDFVPVPQPSEVAEVFEVPLDYLMAPTACARSKSLIAAGSATSWSMAGRASASGARPPPFSTTCVVAWSK
jgi:8-oxo-dGTP pyrophosphatase MutT (NUDIX family)